MTYPTASGWKGLPAYVLAEAGVTRDPDGLVRIPYLLADGGLWAERVVAPDGRRWWRPGDGRPVIPFGLDRQERPEFRGYRCLGLVEGESDALALWAALGHEGLDVLGVPGASCWKSEWAAHADGYLASYVLGDGDNAGRVLNAAVRRDLPEVIAVELPDGEDVRAIIQRDSADVLLDLIGTAERKARMQDAILRAPTLADLYARLDLQEIAA